MNFEMKRYKILYYLVLAIFFSLTTVHGQHLGAKLTDNSVSTNNTELLPFSLLDLSSTEKGFLLPRLTTEERRNIPKADLQQGLMIYNTTIDCMEFYNKTRERWLNLCGEIEPATFVIPDSKCSNIQIEGDYFEGVFLKERVNIIFMEVSVSTPGKYNVEATAYNEGNPNGYAFQGSGIFPEAGNYHIVLRGTGTPIKGYHRTNGVPTSEGDTIKFVLNGKESTCIARNFVEKESLKYEVTRIEKVGMFYTGVSLTDAKSGNLEAIVSGVTMGGTIEINTLDQNGMRFAGTHRLTNAEIAAGTARVVLRGQGAPVTPEATEFKFFTNSYVNPILNEPVDFVLHTVDIEPLALIFKCDHSQYPIRHIGEYEYNVPLTQNERVYIPVQVYATGRGEVIGTVAVEGQAYGQQSELIEFTSGVIDFEFNSSSSDIQYVELEPRTETGKPTVGNKNIKVSFKAVSKGQQEYDPALPNDNIAFTGCSNYEIFVKGNAVEYDMLDVSLFTRFRSISQAGNPYFITPRTQMPADGSTEFTLLVNVMPRVSGEYDIKTDTINGVYFHGEGVIMDAEVGRRKTIVLKAYGKSERDLPKNRAVYTLTGNSLAPQTPPLSIAVDYVYRSMTMYSIGGSSQSWHPGGNNSWTYSGGPRLVRSLENFGWNGVVRIDQLKILGISNAQSGDYKDTSDDIATANGADRFRANLTQSDIVFIGSYNDKPINKQDQQLTDLATYVRNQNGALIYGESKKVEMTNFFSKLGYSIGTQDVTSSSNVVANGGVASQLILGSSTSYFGAKYSGVALANKKIIGGGSSHSKMFSITNLPLEFETIAYNGSTAHSFAYVHKSLGFAGVNSAAFMGGYITTSGSTNSQKLNYPTPATANGAPLKGGDNTYNSWMVLNLVHWAIDYAQEHQPNIVK